MGGRGSNGTLKKPTQTNAERKTVNNKFEAPQNQQKLTDAQQKHYQQIFKTGNAEERIQALKELATNARYVVNGNGYLDDAKREYKYGITSTALENDVKSYLTYEFGFNYDRNKYLSDNPEVRRLSNIIDARRLGVNLAEPTLPKQFAKDMKAKGYETRRGISEEERRKEMEREFAKRKVTPTRNTSLNDDDYLPF